MKKIPVKSPDDVEFIVLNKEIFIYRIYGKKYTINFKSDRGRNTILNNFAKYYRLLIFG